MKNSRMNLGQCIDALKKLDQSKAIYFDWAMQVPTTVCSYRGYFADLAVNFTDKNFILTSNFLETLEKSNNQYFSGYKGGLFQMHNASRLWVANRGETSYTVIVEVKEFLHGNVIVTDSHIEMPNE